MRFHIEQRFTHPVEAVEAALSDPEFVTRVATHPKLGQPQLVARQDDGSRLHLQIRYAFVGDVSPAVRRVVDPARLTWVEDSTTDRSTHRTDFRILPDNYARLLRCEGTFTFVPLDSGCVRQADGDVRVNVPLVGGKVERVIVSGMEDHAGEEADLIEAWLGQGGP